eukprot:4770638-Heterocapsa_arctica.AAC.1
MSSFRRARRATSVATETRALPPICAAPNGRLNSSPTSCPNMGSSRTQHPAGPAIRGGAEATPYAAGPTAGAPAAAPSANGTADASTGTATSG